jgi:hypothetical protein
MSPNEKLFAQGYGWTLDPFPAPIVSVYGFTAGPCDTEPEKVLFELDDGSIHSMFMAGGGHWRELDAEGLEFEREVYEEHQVVDYTERFALQGQRILSASCIDGSHIKIALTGGVMTFTEGPMAVDVLDYRPHPLP